MGNKKPGLDQTKAYIRKLKNPYAQLSIEMTADVEAYYASRDEEKHAYLKELQNPYATEALFGDRESSLDPLGKSRIQSVPVSAQGKLSKKDFKSQCRRIFSQYIPPEEGKTLRAHHRDFVTRNEAKSAETRFLLAAQLKKYDLSAAGNVSPRFNRERDALTKEKLQKIERDIDK